MPLKGALDRNVEFVIQNAPNLLAISFKLSRLRPIFCQARKMKLWKQKRKKEPP